MRLAREGCSHTQRYARTCYSINRAFPTNFPRDRSDHYDKRALLYVHAHIHAFFLNISLRGDIVTMAVERRQSKHVIDIVWFMCSKSADGHCTITGCFQCLRSMSDSRGWRRRRICVNVADTHTDTRIERKRGWEKGRERIGVLAVCSEFLIFDIDNRTNRAMSRMPFCLPAFWCAFAFSRDSRWSAMFVACGTAQPTTEIFVLCNSRDLFTSRKAHPLYRIDKVSTWPVLFVCRDRVCSVSKPVTILFSNCDVLCAIQFISIYVSHFLFSIGYFMTERKRC